MGRFKSWDRVEPPTRGFSVIAPEHHHVCSAIATPCPLRAPKRAPIAAHRRICPRIAPWNGRRIANHVSGGTAQPGLPPHGNRPAPILDISRRIQVLAVYFLPSQGQHYLSGWMGERRQKCAPCRESTAVVGERLGWAASSCCWTMRVASAYVSPGCWAGRIRSGDDQAALCRLPAR